jgi:hypothetical protein
MEEQGTLLEKVTYEFSQDGNCLCPADAYEFLKIEAVSSLGLDRDGKGNNFFILRTEGWSIDSPEKLEELFTRIRKNLFK